MVGTTHRRKKNSFETDFYLLSILCNGHVLFEDLPGLAKTLTAEIFAQSLGCEFKRIQFTSSTSPGRRNRNYVYNRATSAFELRKGPIFCNILLADEINRAPPRTQSALLEAMQERQVTIENETMKLGDSLHRVCNAEPD